MGNSVTNSQIRVTCRSKKNLLVYLPLKRLKHRIKTRFNFFNVNDTKILKNPNAVRLVNYIL
jgi:hypothetical protein